MTLNTKRILIETESHEVLVIHANGRSNLRGFCGRCAGEQELLTLDDAVARSGVAALEIVRRIHSEEVHFLETANGHLLVCCESLSAEPAGYATELTRT